MSSLRRVLKRRFLTGYLELACNAGSPPFAAAVFAEDRLLAAAGPGGDALSAGLDNCLSFPLTVGGELAGHLILDQEKPTPGTGAAGEPLHRTGEAMAFALQALIDSAEAGRAITAETLEVYRELSLLHRAAVNLNQFLDQGDVARSLLAEFQKGGPASQWGAVFFRDDAAGRYLVLETFGRAGAGRPGGGYAQSPVR